MVRRCQDARDLTSVMVDEENFVAQITLIWVWCLRLSNYGYLFSFLHVPVTDHEAVYRSSSSMNSQNSDFQDLLRQTMSMVQKSKRTS